MISSHARPLITSAILKTLKYSNHFDFPLTFSELHTRLVKVKISKSALLIAATQLLATGIIEKNSNYYHLPGRKDLVARRLKRRSISLPQYSQAIALAKRLGAFPNVLAIYLTGSLAMANSDSQADYDFMVITRSHRLWTTRLFLTVFTELIGLRRRPSDSDASGKLCLNLYLTPMSYLLPSHKQSLYTAYELIQAKPLYDPFHTHAQLISANPWISYFLPNYPFPQPISQLQQEYWKTGILEYVLYNLQLLYMRKKITREYITLDSAFFHPFDPAPKL